MEQNHSEQPQPEKKKMSWKDWLVFIIGIGLIVSIKPILRALMSDSSSSSSTSSVQVDLDFPEREPIDFGALVDESFEQAQQEQATE